mmetsp:Transcript_22894/g.39170  ORF Transcript_22894/g.39170 Transcript_22894/m.39170 type:complete len:92 (-) Transcript_22894:549-824(-)
MYTGYKSDIPVPDLLALFCVGQSNLEKSSAFLLPCFVLMKDFAAAALDFYFKLVSFFQCAQKQGRTKSREKLRISNGTKLILRKSWDFEVP